MFVNEVVGVSLGNKLALIWLLDKIFIALLLRKQNGVFLRLEVQMCTLHAIRRRLPAYQGVFPAVPLL